MSDATVAVDPWRETDRVTLDAYEDVGDSYVSKEIFEHELRMLVAGTLTEGAFGPLDEAMATIGRVDANRRRHERTKLTLLLRSRLTERIAERLMDAAPADAPCAGDPKWGGRCRFKQKFIVDRRIGYCKKHAEQGAGMLAAKEVSKWAENAGYEDPFAFFWPAESVEQLPASEHGAAGRWRRLREIFALASAGLTAAEMPETEISAFEKEWGRSV